MPLHRFRFYLKLVIACALLAIVEVVVWGTFTSQPDVAVRKQETRQSPATLFPQHRHLPALREFAPFSGRQLRQPLYSATTPAPASPAANQPARTAPLMVRLLGTILEDGQATAIIADHLGKQEIKRVGERVGVGEAGPTIVEIDRERIVIDAAGGKTTVSLEKPPTLEDLPLIQSPVEVHAPAK